MNLSPVFIGSTARQPLLAQVKGEYITLLGETFYKIHRYDAMEPFFISVVSSSDHWLFISTTGGLSAGRGSAEQSLFPYYTVDKISENSENTGSKAILLVTRDQKTSLWEPFSDRYQGCYRIERNLYKNIPGTALVFEEVNLDLGLAYRYAWQTGDAFGFVKTSWLTNLTGAGCRVELLDGLQNLLPASITSTTQNIFSVLLDAYKRSELEPGTGLGLFALSSTLTDLAEPSEALRATTVAQLGLESLGYLLSSAQLDRFRRGQGIEPEVDVRGRRSAYFVHAALDLKAGQERRWRLIAEVGQDSAVVARLVSQLRGDQSALDEAIERDVRANSANLWKIVASADGLQTSNDRSCTVHHFANVMFNVMRGGIFVDQYQVEAADLRDFIAARNHSVLQQNAEFFKALPLKIDINALLERARASGSADLLRLCSAYLPLTFSRRHGDPSRPWNRFAIKLKKPDGSQQLDYEGNWRDIFQNWEALAYSYPEFVENMLTVFLSATTVDGYNPYRITRQGLDWEVPEPNNPWANIGYWSDHQIIYLQKLMEVSAKFHPGKLEGFLSQPLFCYANVPYRIKPYSDLLKDPYNSIEFNWELERQIEGRVRERGADGKLVLTQEGQVMQVSLAEKLLTLLLAKLANFVPEGGIWMNTQRPEWNDANNALVGRGLSVVTLCYLRRYIAFCTRLFASSTTAEVPVHQEVLAFYQRVAEILGQYRPLLAGSFNDEQRRAVLDALGSAGSEYRWNYYQNGLTGEVTQAPAAGIAAFLQLAQAYVDHSLRANRRSDHLYHAYNILHITEGRASVSPLYEMLEGQVAVLSSGLLSGQEALDLLRSMRHSTLYRADQHSYILYPDRELPGFLVKNCIAPAQVANLALVKALVETQDGSLLIRDVDGIYHFNGFIRNAKDVAHALEALACQPRFANLVAVEGAQILALFESIFHHDAFTGRSGTFFAYEGLGSIYWHMVSKLLLAVQESVLWAENEPAGPALAAIYADVRKGLGFNKTPAVYGAFPTDPYSHTPKGQGAKQPGMTGMVKEEILTRLAELGLVFSQGRLSFDPTLVDRQELLAQPAVLDYLDVSGQWQKLDLPAGSLAGTLCQVPVVLQMGDSPRVIIYRADGVTQAVNGLTLDLETSQHIFHRDGIVHHLNVFLPK